MTIDSPESLRAHLQTAIEIEHATLPPYLCALYSIKDGANQEAAAVIQSVVLEEMLHLTLAANVLNAVGGSPVLDAPHLLPAYPTFLPHSNRAVEVSLRPFSPEALATFMAIEKPGPRDSAPEDDVYETIGQFYAAIEDALVRLSAELGEAVVFSGDPTRQVTDALYYGGGGRIVAVTDLASARRALDEIVEQGEGLDHESIIDGDRDMFHPDRDELAHYFRFHELALGRRYLPGDTPHSGPTGEPVTVDWSGVHPMRTNPRSVDYPPGSDIRAAMDGFNRSYSEVLALLQQCFNGDPQLLAIATGAMYGIKGQMIALMQLDCGDGSSTVGPSFEWVAPRDRRAADIRIVVIPNGPYLVSGEIAVHEATGALRKSTGTCVLCRCGGSRTKPFCDGTHARIGFNGTESADHGLIADRRKRYPTPDGLTVYDDRTRCAHFGQCTDRLPNAFGVSEEAFVDPAAAPSQEIARVTAGCPSGALSFALPGQTDPVESHERASIHPIVDGPYRVRGGIQVISADGQGYEIRERQTLCRCGQSRNKPFCDGSHWYAGFRDPLPPELVDAPTLPWEDPRAAERGRARYAAEHASSDLRSSTDSGADGRSG
jgi:CDGSH-type Zn-finger protein